MKVTHSYIVKNGDIIHISSDNGIPRNFTMYGPGLWKLWDWSAAGSAVFEQIAEIVSPAQPRVVINQTVFIVVEQEVALLPISLAEEVCDIVAAHFIDDGRCFFQGVDILPDGKILPKSLNRSTRMYFDKSKGWRPETLGVAKLSGCAAKLAPMLMPEAAAEMEKTLKTL